MAERLAHFGTGGLDGITLNSLYAPFLKICLIAGKKTINSGFHPKIELNQIAESWIAHEMGHVLQFLIMEANDYRKSPQNMKGDIINLATRKYNSTNRVISKYGEINVYEWWAEVFAHLECCNNPSPLGLAMRDYINTLFENKLRV